jgi:hypothetical protein
VRVWGLFVRYRSERPAPKPPAPPPVERRSGCEMPECYERTAFVVRLRVNGPRISLCEQHYRSHGPEHFAEISRFAALETRYAGELEHGRPRTAPTRIPSNGVPCSR